jgi:hypothetical protein
MEINIKRILIVTVGGLFFWFVMEKTGTYARIEKML